MPKEWTGTWDTDGFENNLRSTPLFIDGVLYAPNIFGLVEAFDPATGERVWHFQMIHHDLWEYDKSSGNTVFEIDLTAGTTGAPMTYLHEGKQYIVVAVSSRATEPEWIALGLGE